MEHQRQTALCVLPREGRCSSKLVECALECEDLETTYGGQLKESSLFSIKGP